MEKPLLSILIPTKNRYEYLQGCLLSLKGLPKDKVEIIIQDNSDDNTKAREILECIQQDNYQYSWVDTPLTQAENCSAAVQKSSGHYVCFIGDDDTVTLLIPVIAQFLNDRRIDACVFDMATYIWPDAITHSHRKPVLSYEKPKYKIRNLDTKRTLNGYLLRGMQDIKFLPRAYHALISRQILEEIKVLTGSYFPGVSPDMANAVAAAILIDRHIYIEAPLIISGYGYNSGGGLGLRNAHKGRLSDLGNNTVVAQVTNEHSRNWHQKNPRLWLGNTLWPEAAVQAIIRTNRTTLLGLMNWHAVYAKIVIKHWEYLPDIIPFLSSIIDWIRFTEELLTTLAIWFYKQIKKRILSVLKIRHNYFEIMSLDEAKRTIELVLDERELLERIKEYDAR